MEQELRELSFGEILGKSFNLLFENFPRLFLTYLVVHIIYQFLFQIFLNPGFQSWGSDYDRLISIIIVAFISFVLNLLAAVMISRFSYNQYLGYHSNYKNVFGEAVKMSGQILKVTCIVITASIAVGALYITLRPYFDFSFEIKNVIIWIFILILIGILIGFSCIVPVLVFEKKTVIESFRRSWALTEGRRLKILGYFGISYVFILIFEFIGDTFGEFIYQTFGALPGSWAFLIFFSIVYSVFYPLLHNLMLLNYINMRIKKEGFAVEHLADQFDSENKESVKDDN